MSSLTELEENGLTIVALIRDGQLDHFKCSSCTEEMRSQRNCDGVDVDTSVYYHPLLGELNACPLTFIPETIHTWFDRYSYIEKYPSTAPDYDKVIPRFWDATKFYDNIVYTIQSDKTTKENTNDNLSKMAGLFNKGSM